jgi:hypothetical protein
MPIESRRLAPAGTLLLLLCSHVTASAQTVGPAGGWVQVQVDDFDTRPTDANYVLSYGRGGIGWRWSLNKDVFAFKATWTEPPKVIAPTDRVRISISVSITENAGQDYSANGNFSIFFDQPDVEPGSVSSPIGFGNDKGETGGIDVSHRGGTPGSSVSREVWVDAASLPRGSDGARIALLVSAYIGRTAGTRYVYEWRAPPAREPVAAAPPPAPTPAVVPGGEPTPTPAPLPSPGPARVSLTVGPAAVAADGEATAEAVFRYTDEEGRPVGGVALRWRLGPRLAPAELGSLVSADAATGADGTARAVYRAPLLEARSMQEIGERKGRDIAVDYGAGERGGSRTATLTLLKTAPAHLVIDKPGLVRSRVPIRLGSLNGRIEGTVQLRASHRPNSTTTTTEPLNDAAVSIESPLLEWAAVSKATSDEKGRFTIAMKMGSWEHWDLSLRAPILLEPDGELAARQLRLLSALGQWPASPAVKLRAFDLVSEAPARLARLKAPEAEGFADKIQMTAWMLSLLKDGRGDAKTAAGELLGHGWSLLMAAGECFYADSRLEKAIDDKYRHIDAVKKVRRIQAWKAREVKSLADKAAVRDLMNGWLARLILSGAPTDADAAAAGRFRRSLVDKVFLAKAAAAISEFVAEKVTELVKDLVPDVGGFLTDAMLEPYDTAANDTVLLFLANSDYPRIHAVSAVVEIRLGRRKSELGREFQRVTQWRIREDGVQALAATASEATQAYLQVMAAGLGAPALAAAAKKLEKAHEAIGTVATAVRFAEELFTFSGIVSKTADTVLAATAEAAGVPPRVAARGPSAPPTETSAGPEAFPLLPIAHAAEGPSLDLAGGFDWATFVPRDGRVPVEALGQLALARPAVDNWLAGNLVSLLAVAEGDPQGMTALLDREAEWSAAVLEAHSIALQSLEKPMGPADEARWTAAVNALRERTGALQSRIAAAAQAAGSLGPDPDAGLRQAIADKQGIEPAPAPAVPQAESRPWLLLAAAATGLAAGLLGLGLVLWRVARRRDAGAAAAAPSPEPVAPPAAPSAVPQQLTDARGQAYALDRECLTLGTAADNDVVLASPHASRHHARVWRTPEGACWIEDLGSTNGTWVDGRRTEKAWLQPGSLVALGDEALRVS